MSDHGAANGQQWTGDDTGSAGGFEPRVALASLSGQSDAAWARAALPDAGAAFLGGIAIDGATREAAQSMVARGREEFLPPDPVAFVDGQLGALADAPLLAGVNVRTTALDPLARVAEVCARRGAVLEINAHCRQDEMCRAGAGEALLADAGRLCEQVRTAHEADAPVSVKVRTETGVDLPGLAQRVAAAGADVVHVDAMDSEPVVGAIAEATDLFVVANNGVRDRGTVREYLARGADAVSVGRPSDDPDVLARVREATDDWFADECGRTDEGNPGRRREQGDERAQGTDSGQSDEGRAVTGRAGLAVTEGRRGEHR